MFTRILSTTLTAAALVTAAPAFAAEKAPARQACSCCSDGSIHGTDHALRHGKKHQAAPVRASVDPSRSDDPFVRNQSFGG